MVPDHGFARVVTVQVQALCRRVDMRFDLMKLHPMILRRQTLSRNHVMRRMADFWRNF